MINADKEWIGLRSAQLATIAAILSAGRMSPTGETMMDAERLIIDAAELLVSAEKYVNNAPDSRPP